MTHPALRLLPFAAVVAVAVFAATTLSGGRAPATASTFEHVRWGDADCDGTLGGGDLVQLMRVEARLGQNSNSCSSLGVGSYIYTDASVASLPYAGRWSDWNCDQHVDLLDGLSLLSHLASPPGLQTIGCITYGDFVDAEIVLDPPATPPAIQSLAIDTDSAGNGALTLGATESCGARAVNDEFTIDVVAKGIPPVSGFAGGLGGFEFDFLYSPTAMRVTAVNTSLMLAVPPANLISYNEGTPDTDGRLKLRIYDQGNSAESGDGVLARITLKALAAGVTPLSLADPTPYQGYGMPLVVDRQNWIYDVDSVAGAQIAVASTCPQATPTPTASPSPTPSPTPAPTPGATNECLNQVTPIPDNDPAGVELQFHYDLAIDIDTMAVCLNIAHQWVGDLRITLTHADTGDSILLVDRLSDDGTDGTCSGGGNGLYVYLTDTPNPALSLQEACQAQNNLLGELFASQYFTDVDLGGPFGDDQSAGDWVIKVSDEHQGGIGEIRGAALYFNP